MASTSIPEGYTLMSDQEKRKIYAKFQEKVKRTVYLEHLSPQVTEEVIKSALGQVGQVKNVDFLPNEVLPLENLAQAALFEMESEKKANAVITTLNDFPFMMSGIPRPVRAKAAWPKLFPNRPPRPGLKQIEFRWVSPSDPDADDTKNLAMMAKRQQVERVALIEAQLQMEEKLAEQQQEALTANHKKYEIMDKPMNDGAIPKLASYYDILLADDI